MQLFRDKFKTVGSSIPIVQLLQIGTDQYDGWREEACGKLDRTDGWMEQRTRQVHNALFAYKPERTEMKNKAKFGHAIKSFHEILKLNDWEFSNKFLDFHGDFV